MANTLTIDTLPPSLETSYGATSQTNKFPTNILTALEQVLNRPTQGAPQRYDPLGSGPSRATSLSILVTFEQLKEIHELLTLYTTRWRNHQLAELISLLERVIVKARPIRKCYLTPTFLAKLKAYVQHQVRDELSAMLSRRTVDLFVMRSAPVDFSFNPAQNRIALTDTSLTKVYEDPSRRVVADEAFSWFGMDFGVQPYRRGNHVYVGDAGAVLDAKIHLIAQARAIQSQALVEIFTQTIPFATPPQVLPESEFSLAACPLTNRILKDSHHWYRSKWNTDMRSHLIPGFWDTDLDDTTWNAAPYSFGFPTAMTDSKLKWRYAYYFIKDYINTFVALYVVGV
nr:P10 protein [Carrot reovirus 1]